MRCVFVFIALIICSFSLFGQKIHLQKHGEDNFYYLYEVQKTDNWFRLASLSGNNVDKLQTFNTNKILHPGDTIKVPMYLDHLVTDRSKISNIANYKEVWYQVSAKDNLFRLSRNYFYQPMERLMKQNQKTSVDLSIHEKLLVGYVEKKLMPIQSIQQPSSISNENKIERITIATPKDKTLILGNPAVEQAKFVQYVDPKDGLEHTEVLTVTESKMTIEPNTVKVDSSKTLSILDTNLVDVNLDSISIDSVAVTTAEIKTQIVRRRGMGVWDASLPKSSKLYVLHSRAKPNTTIKITNPLLSRTIEATVIDKIPRNIYPNDVVILISPQVKEKLGIRDKRFRVELEYTEVIK